MTSCYNYNDVARCSNDSWGEADGLSSAEQEEIISKVKQIWPKPSAGGLPAATLEEAQSELQTQITEAVSSSNGDSGFLKFLNGTTAGEVRDTGLETYYSPPATSTSPGPPPITSTMLK